MNNLKKKATSRATLSTLAPKNIMRLETRLTRDSKTDVKINYICFTKCRGQDQKCLDTNMIFVTRDWRNKTEWTVQFQAAHVQTERQKKTDNQNMNLLAYKKNKKIWLKRVAELMSYVEFLINALDQINVIVGKFAKSIHILVRIFLYQKQHFFYVRAMCK